MVFDLEEANRSLSSIVAATWRQLELHRECNVSDEIFVLKLLKEFVELRKVTSPDAGSMHMALSCYRMAMLENYINELEDKVEFYKDSIDMLLDLQNPGGYDGRLRAGPETE